MREVGFAGPEDHGGRRAAEAALQVRAVGREGDRPGRRAPVEERRADVEDFRDPFVAGVGVKRSAVDDLAHARAVRPQQRLERLREVPVVDARDGAGVDGNARFVGDRVRVEAAADRAHVHRGLAHHRVRLDRKVEVVENADDLRHLDDGVVAELGHRAVRGNSLRLDLEPGEALVADVGIVRCRFRDDDRAGAIEQALVGKVARAFTADLLAGGEHEGDARCRPQVRRELDRGRDDRRDSALHVRGAATIQSVAIGLAGESVARPFRRPEGHRVDVPREADGRLRRGPADGGDEARARVRELVVRDAEAGAFEQAAEMARARAFHARWVDGVVAKELARQVARFDAAGHGA